MFIIILSVLLNSQLPPPILRILSSTKFIESLNCFGHCLRPDNIVSKIRLLVIDGVYYASCVYDIYEYVYIYIYIY